MPNLGVREFTRFLCVLLVGITIVSLSIPARAAYYNFEFINSPSVTGINNLGHVVGNSGNPFVYKNGSTTTLGLSNSSASGINDHGTIVGHSITNGQQRAFVYNNGTSTLLGTLGGSSSVATAVNNVGQIAGVSTTASGNVQAFLSAMVR